MKRLFFFSLFLILSFNLFAQTPTWVDTSKARADKYRIAGNNNPFPVQVISPSTAEVAPNHSFYSIDTLLMSSTAADTSNDTIVHYFRGKWLYGFVCIDDSQKASSGALIDSIYVDRYDTATATWRAYMVGFRNMYDNYDYSNPLVPGNNLQKMYLINEPYPMTYRVRYAAYWGNAGKLVRKTIIRWVWKAQ